MTASCSAVRRGGAAAFRGMPEYYIRRRRTASPGGSQFDGQARDPFTLSVTGLLSEDLMAAKRYEEAETQFRDLVAARLKVLGPEHPMTLTSKSALAQDLLYQNRYPEAEALSRETFELQQRVIGPDSKATLDTA